MDEQEQLESLQRSRSNILTILEQITASPKPSYSIDGQRFSWGEYLKQLNEALRDINSQIAQMDEGELTSYMVP